MVSNETPLTKNSKSTMFEANILLTMGANVILTILGIVTGSIAARLLGPSGRGELAAIQNWPSVFVTLGALGIPQAVVYYVGHDQHKAGRVMTTALGILLTLSVILMGVGYLSMPYLLSVQSDYIIQLARLYLLFIPLSFILGIPVYTLQGCSDLLYWNLVRLISPIVWLVVLITSFAFGFSNVSGLVIGYLFVVVIGIVVTWYIALRRISGPYILDLENVIPIFRFGIPTALGNFPLVLNLRLDQLLLAAWMKPQTLGLYVSAVAFGNGLSPFLSAIANVTFPKLASLQSKDEIHDHFAQIVRISMIFCVGLTTFFLVCTPFAIRLLFGNAFLPAIPAAFILVIAGGLAGVNNILEDGLRGLGRPGSVFIAELIGLFATIILLSLLIEKYEIVGAAVASLVSYGLIFVTLILLSSRICELSIFDILIIRRSDISVVWKRLRTFTS